MRLDDGLQAAEAGKAHRTEPLVWIDQRGQQGD
jgi:hypothetical protein